MSIKSKSRELLNDWLARERAIVELAYFKKYEGVPPPHVVDVACVVRHFPDRDVYLMFGDPVITVFRPKIETVRENGRTSLVMTAKYQEH